MPASPNPVLIRPRRVKPGCGADRRKVCGASMVMGDLLGRNDEQMMDAHYSFRLTAASSGMDGRPGGNRTNSPPARWAMTSSLGGGSSRTSHWQKGNAVG